jgi:hypothetical protein
MKIIRNNGLSRVITVEYDDNKVADVAIWCIMKLVSTGGVEPDTGVFRAILFDYASHILRTTVHGISMPVPLDSETGEPDYELLVKDVIEEALKWGEIGRGEEAA